MIIFKFFLLQLVIGLPGLFYSSTFGLSTATYFSFLLYAIYSTAIVMTFLNKVDVKAISNNTAVYERYFITIIVVITFLSVIVILFEHSHGLMSLIIRDRIARQELFEYTVPILTTYFILFSSSVLFYFLGSLATILSRAKFVFLGILVCYIADSVTDSRSSVLAFLIGVISAKILFFPFTYKQAKYLATIGIMFVPFLLIGQESIDDGVLFLRVFSYISAPPLLTEHIYSTLDSPFTQSALELVFWPIQSMSGIKLFDTQYEYTYYALSSGIHGNVLIPSYAVFYDFSDAAAFLLLSLCCFFIATTLNKTSKQYSVLTSIWIVSIFGPVSILLNPFLAEKGFFFLLIVLLYPLVDRKINVRFSLHQ